MTSNLALVLLPKSWHQCSFISGWSNLTDKWQSGARSRWLSFTCRVFERVQATAFSYISFGLCRRWTSISAPKPVCKKELSLISMPAVVLQHYFMPAYCSYTELSHSLFSQPPLPGGGAALGSDKELSHHNIHNFQLSTTCVLAALHDEKHVCQLISQCWNHFLRWRPPHFWSRRNPNR